MVSGYILISKSIMCSDVWKKPPNYIKIWMYLLLNAQYSDYGNLKRGQLFITIQELIDVCTYYAGYRRVAPSKKEIYRILEWLRCPYEAEYEKETKAPMIVTTKVTHGIVVTICNYSDYQDPKKYERENGGTTKSTRMSLRKGDKGNNIKNENKKNIRNKDILSCKHDIVERIIQHLNDRAGTNYRANTKSTAQMINARLSDGFSEEDFYTVIDNQCDRWLDDEKMRDYLRPSTLFAPSKFEGYLNNAPSKKRVSQAEKKQSIENAKEELNKHKLKLDRLKEKYKAETDKDIKHKTHIEIADLQVMIESLEKYLKKQNGFSDRRTG